MASETYGTARPPFVMPAGRMVHEDGIEPPTDRV
jgi:hypothetical protein